MGKNKKPTNLGFTLIELLAVLIILMILAVIILPKIIKEIGKTKDIALTTQINQIIDISKVYMNKNTNLLPNEGTYVITFQELQQAKLIDDKTITNPKTQQPLEGCITVKYTKNKYKYQYEEGTICNK